ncbi:hypothetical protein BGP_4705 [Beggiatoa sp. PS]|nr:hypothetical protein BGP_4705 [Beggiatoa sp. PS]
MTRIYAKENLHFLSSESFQLGNVRRLVTLGTPHIGSESSKFLWWFRGNQRDRDLVNNCVDTQGTLPSIADTINHQQELLECVELFGCNDNDIPPPQNQTGEWWLQTVIDLMDNTSTYKDLTDNTSIDGIVEMAPDWESHFRTNEGGVNDLRVEGNFVSLLNKNPSTEPGRILATRAIVGDTGRNILEGLVPQAIFETLQNVSDDIEWDSLEDVIRDAVGCSHNDLFDGNNSDGVVPTYSATGERILSGGFNPITVPNSPHLGMGTDTNMIQQAIDNLNGQISNFVKH